MKEHKVGEPGRVRSFQRQLWAATFIVMSLFAGALIYAATSWRPSPDGIEPSRVLLAFALGCSAASFVLYAIGRERNLHRLAARLIEQQVAAARMAERLAHVDELARERDTSDALLHASADGIVVVDADLRIVRFNPAMELLSGLRATHAIGRSLEAALPLGMPDGAELTGETHPARAALLDGVPRPGIELLLTTADGTPAWVSATVSPVRPDGRPPMALVTLRDIAGQKAQEIQQRDFVSMAAHELRTPLTAIKGFTRTLMLKHDVLSEDRRAQYLSMVNEQSNRLALLVDDLMVVSRIDSHHVTLRPGSLEMPSLIRALVEQFRTKWTDREIEVVADATLPPAWGDRHRVEEILINLIDNAIKYSPAGSPVRVAVAASPESLTVAITDRGVGISQAEAATLFQKFHRLKHPDTVDVSGTGLGLYIVKGLVEAHGGTVEVTSRPGEGSTFSFSLPLDAAAAADRLGA